MTFSALNLLLVLIAAFVGGRLAVRIGYPAVLGEIIMGILLGPPLLGLMHPSPALAVLADLGVLLMMMYVGMEMDVLELKRAFGSGLATALGGFFLPFALGLALMLWWQYPLPAALFVGIAMGVTSLATKSRILLDLGILNTGIAKVMMAGALITDTLSLILFSAVIGFATYGTVNFLESAAILLKALCFFIGSWVLGIYGIPRLYTWLQFKGLTNPSLHASLALMMALTFAELAELADLHGVIGTFLAGMFLRSAMHERRLSYEISSLVRNISVGFLASIFFLTAGFSVSFHVFQTQFLLVVLIILVATFAKIIGSLVAYRITGGNWREGLVIGLGMNDRGAVEIILAGIALRAGLISQDIFSILVFMAIVTTATVPILLTWGVKWLSKYQSLSPQEESTGLIFIGAGPIVRLMAHELQKSQPVTLIDSNAKHCNEAKKLGLKVINGDALDDATLLDAGVTTASALIGFTGNAAVNVLALQLAHDANAGPTMFALIEPDETSGLYKQLQRLGAKLLYGQAVNLQVWENSLEAQLVSIRHVDISNETLEAPIPMAGILPLLVLREGSYQLFHKDYVFKPGDQLLCLNNTLTPKPPF